ncbi:MAG TPA: hypothetical protein VF980_10985 [Thermoanaerobaculia bacterium]
MRRSLIAVVLLVFALPLFGEISDRAMTLAPNGTLYSVESRANDGTGDSVNLSSRYLTLTIQKGENIIKTDVPATMTGGKHWQPEIAFDADSDTALVFWLHSADTAAATSELEFCTFQNGRWNDPALVDDSPNHIRYNLRLGVTQKVEMMADDGSSTSVDGLTVHAVWWDVTAAGEVARYAMIVVEHGVVTSIVRRDLVDLVNRAFLKYADIDPAYVELLRHPIVYESTEHETVDVVFGDLNMNLLHRLTLKPISQSRVRIPIGIREASYPAPQHAMSSTAVRLSAINTSPERLAIYYVEAGDVRYLRYESGTWTDNSVALNKDVSAEAAVAALRKLVSGD